ncbi:MAG: MurR/RpiR family transcriptional regulator [Chloroflexi bacterium]|nr:MurR/RpiR family transcriptional regulator [Chloroflexota bacterium]
MASATTFPEVGAGPLAERVAARLADLSPTERRVAQFMAAHPEEAAFLSAADVAGQLGTSDATVVRAVQALGYAGLPELKRELIEVLKSRATPALRLGRSLEEIGSADPAAALHHAIDQQIDLLEDARRSVRPEAFQHAVDVLARAEHVHVFGVGPTGALAEYFAIRLGRFGRPATAITTTGLLLADSLLSLRPGQVLVVLSYARVITEVEVLLARARRLDVPVVLLTDTLATALADRVDVALSARRGRSGGWSTISTTLVLIDALLFGLAARDRARVLTSLETLNEIRAALVGQSTVEGDWAINDTQPAPDD